jgi:hypothetical protein
MLSVQTGDRDGSGGGQEEKTEKTEALPWIGAAFVFSVLAVDRKLRLIR